MAVDDVAVLRVVGRYQDQNIINTLHYIIMEQVGSDTAQWQDLVDDWLTANGSPWLASHIDTYTLVGVKAFSARGGAKPPGFASADSAGTVVGANQEAYIGRTITLYTDDANPRKRGRIQLSGGAEEMFNPDDGGLLPDEIVDLNGLGAQLMNDITEGDNVYRIGLYEKLLDNFLEIIQAKGRITPSIIRSRRVKQFLIG